VRAWLGSREGVVEVQSDDDAIRFRVEGGFPVWIFDDEAPIGGGSVGGDPDAGSAAAAARTSATGTASSEDVIARVVLGEGSEVKRALVLAPFSWQFAEHEESPEVAAILSGTTGYEGRVQLLEVTEESSPPIPLSVYTSWDDYDVVHVSSHGKTICEEGVCRAMLNVVHDDRPIEQVEADWHGPGVYFSYGSVTGNRYVMLTADFFLDQYPQGMGDTIVFLSACETLSGGTTDLADAIRGSKGVYLGWSEPVQSPHARLAALAFYTHMSDAGVTVGTAYDELGDLKVNRYTSSKGFDVEAFLRVTPRADGGDLRLRDIVTLESPAGGAPLADEAVVLIDGTLGDGNPDRIPYRVRVDGVDAPPGYFMVHVEIGGVAAPSASLADADAPEDGVRVLTGTLDMGRDLAEDEALEIRAWVDLPDLGISEASGTIVVQDDPGYWVGRAAFLRDWDDGQMEAESDDLRFEYDPDTGRFYLTEGTLRWSRRGSTFDTDGTICTYELPTTSIPLPAGSAFIIISHAFSPARYSVHGSYEGAVITLPTSCPGLTIPVRFNGVWLRTSNGVNEVSDDGESLVGSYVEDLGFLRETWSWEFEWRSGS
jgi:hypothetical protein